MLVLLLFAIIALLLSIMFINILSIMEWKKVSRLIKTTLVVFAVLMFGYSCTTEEYYGPNWQIENYTIKPNDWKWNADMGWYECVVNCPKLTKFVYEEGVVLAQIFLGTQGVDEVQRILPYIQSYCYNHVDYTRTISFDYNVGTVCFYYQDSDLEREVINENYYFKVTLFW